MAFIITGIYFIGHGNLLNYYTFVLNQLDMMFNNVKLSLVFLW